MHPVCFLLTTYLQSAVLKHPQLQSLNVGRAPLTEAYQQLVEVFLCTETTHSLPLTIEGIEEKSKWIKTMMLMKMMMLMKNNDYYGDSNWLWKKENELSDDEQLSSDHELN